VKKKKTGFKAPVAQFIAIIALTISVFLIVDFGRRAAASYRIQREADRLQQEVEAARRYQARLLEQRTYAASDLYVEEIARRELKWAKPGETVIVVLPQSEMEKQKSTFTKDVQGTPGPVSPQQAWWQLFFEPSPSDDVDTVSSIGYTLHPFGRAGYFEFGLNLSVI